MNKSMMALIGMVLALVFILVALIGPWYGGTMKTSGAGMESTMESSSSLTASTANDETKSHADAKAEIEAAGGDTAVYDIFSNTLYITIIAFICALIAVIGILGVQFNFGSFKTMKMLGSIFGILTFILALVAILYFMTAIPAETGVTTQSGESIGFWYSESESAGGYEMTVSYGPGYGWYLMLLAAIIALVASIPLFKKQPA